MKDATRSDAETPRPCVGGAELCAGRRLPEKVKLLLGGWKVVPAGAGGACDTAGCELLLPCRSRLSKPALRSALAGGLWLLLEESRKFGREGVGPCGSDVSANACELVLRFRFELRFAPAYTCRPAPYGSCEYVRAA